MPYERFSGHRFTGTRLKISALLEYNIEIHPSWGFFLPLDRQTRRTKDAAQMQKYSLVRGPWRGEKLTSGQKARGSYEIACLHVYPMLCSLPGETPLRFYPGA